jgi:hypothetical protein
VAPSFAVQNTTELAMPTASQLDGLILMNVNLLLPTVTVAGPRVTVNLADSGTAQICMSMMISDGSSFSSAGGMTMPPDTTLPAGVYLCSATITAGNLGAFGDNYNARVIVAGQIVASAQGSDLQKQVDTGHVIFQMVVQ